MPDPKDNKPKARKVTAVPKGYTPVPNMPNYFQNPQQAAQASNTGSTTKGPKMSNEEWAKFVAARQATQQNTQSNDIVFMEPAPVAAPASKVKAFDGQLVYDNKGHATGMYKYNVRDAKNNQSGITNAIDNWQDVQYTDVDGYGKPKGNPFTVPGGVWSNQITSGLDRVFHPEILDTYRNPKPVVPVEATTETTPVVSGATLKMGGKIKGKKYGLGTDEPIDPNDPLGLRAKSLAVSQQPANYNWMNFSSTVNGQTQKPITPLGLSGLGDNKCYDTNGMEIPCPSVEDSNYNPAQDMQKGMPTVQTINDRGELVGGTGAVETSSHNTKGDGSKKGPNMRNIEWGVTAGLTAIDKILGDIDTKKRERTNFEKAVRLNTFAPTYNPYAYGNGSQAIMEQGGAIPANGDTQVLQGGKAEQISESSISNPMMEFKGNTHAQGGIDIQHGKKGAEVEHGEVGWVDPQGALNIFGKLKVPGTNRTFKLVAKDLAKAEGKIDKNKTKSLQTINNTDPTDKYAGSAFETAKVMYLSQDIQAKDIAMKKEELAGYQSAILNMIDHTAKKAEFGAKIEERPKMATGGSLSLEGLTGGPGDRLYEKFKKTQADALVELQKLYPGKKVEVKYNTDRDIKTQRGLRSKGASKTDVSLHNFGAASDYNIYVDGKFIGGNTAAGKEVYKATVWKAAAANGLHNLNWASDPYHISAVAEGGKTPGGAFKGLLKQYPEIINDPAYKKTLDYITNLVNTGKASTSEINAYQQITGKKVSGKAANINYADYAGSFAAPGKDYTLVGEDYIQNTFLSPANQRGKDPQALKIPGSTNVTTQSPTPDVNNPLTVDTNGQPITATTADDKPKQTFNTPALNTGNVSINNANRIRDFQSPLDIRQVTPELLTLASNQRDPVTQLVYQPDLKQTFDMSYQLGRNENQSTFNQVAKIAGQTGNVDSLSDLAAQKYKADETYNNAEVQNNAQQKLNVYSDNTNTLNDAKLKNLSLIDTQQDRIAQGKFNQRKEFIGAIGSFADKSLKNSLENKTYNAYANLFPDYGFDTRGNVTFDRKDAIKWQSGDASAYLASQGKNLPDKSITTTDGDGNTKKITNINSDLEKFNTIWKNKDLSEAEKAKILKDNSIYKTLNP